MPPDIVWPPRILKPSRPPALVYLDLNHYIYLARAAAGDATVPAGYGALLIVVGRPSPPTSSELGLDLDLADPRPSKLQVVASTVRCSSAERQTCWPQPGRSMSARRTAVARNLRNSA